jgi:hypothetical protein
MRSKSLDDFAPTPWTINTVSMRLRCNRKLENALTAPLNAQGHSYRLTT